MSQVTLQYEEFGVFKTARLEDTQDAIELARRMFVNQEAKPLRILNHNGAVAVSENALKVKIGDPTGSKQIIKDAAAEKRRRDQAFHDTTLGVKEDKRRKAKDELNREMETLPGYGSF